ncbi:uncharacterized protein LOC123566599 [Mercenaria mercenaria]|uniref:uncharacterized protein LOC123566599 n=1 Tax=Mercenaria mercenaria TaxID=6596 RepID=UPI00234F34DB|nr:uncharacterized protein LOC123566599 [Mercenaria mercenaria]
MCKHCELFGTTAAADKPFVKRGVQLGTHPTRKLLSHSNSKYHKFSVERYTLAKSSINVYRQLQIKDAHKKASNRSALKKIFKCLDFVIKQKWAVTENAEKFIKFVANIGVVDLQAFLSSSSVTYLSSSSITEMVMCLSDYLEREVLTDLSGKEFSLLADESSDISNRSQMSVMIRCGSADGIESVRTFFMGFVQLEKGTAECITNSLETFLLGKNINVANIRFSGFDGCNTMSGVQKGVQRRVQHVSPFSVYINCRNHRLALCLAHLIKRFPLLQDVDTTLLSLWKLFEFSPQKLAVFKHIQAVYGKDPLTITRAAATRWLSHLQASARFISRYVCILDTLDAIYAEKREPEIRGIRQNVTDKNIVATVLLLCDILKPVNMLSLYLQEENVNFTSLPERVKVTIDSLTSLVAIYRRYSGNLVNSETEFAKCDQLFLEIDDRTALERRMRQNNLDLTPDAFLEETGIPLVYELVQEIEDAFNHGDPVLNAFGFFNPQNLPENVSDLPEYGNASIQRLVAFYGSPKTDIFNGHTTNVPALMNPVQLETELKSVKVQLYMLSVIDFKIFEMLMYTLHSQV